MIAYDYENFKNDAQILSSLCREFQADTIVAVARGGMTLAHALSMALDIRNLQSVRAESYDGNCQRDSITVSGQCDFSDSSRILIVDDIVDSGQTLASLMPQLRSEHPNCEFKTVALFTKPTALLQPDYSLHEATDWIDFFWERDYLKSDLL